MTLCHLPPSSCRAGLAEAAPGLTVLAGPCGACSDPKRRRISPGNAGGLGTAPAPSCRRRWRCGAGEELWSCSPRGSTASGMCGQGTDSCLARLAVGCGDCQLCFLEGQRTLLAQAWPVSDSLLRREEPPAGSSPSQDFHYSRAECNCRSCSDAFSKGKLRGARGAPSTEHFPTQGIGIVSGLSAVSPSRLGQMSASVPLGDGRWILISHECRRVLPTLRCHAAPLGTSRCQRVR